MLQNSSTEVVMFQTIFDACAVYRADLFDRYGRIPIAKIGTIGSIVGLLGRVIRFGTHDAALALPSFGASLFYAAVLLLSAGALAHGY